MAVSQELCKQKVTFLCPETLKASCPGTSLSRRPYRASGFGDLGAILSLQVGVRGGSLPGLQEHLPQEGFPLSRCCEGLYCIPHATTTTPKSPCTGSKV